MDDDILFAMVEECVAYAQERLEHHDALPPFAMTTDASALITTHTTDENDDTLGYERLLERLQRLAKTQDVTAAALTARVTIPEHFKPTVTQGIRIHVEERATSHNKLAARFIYIPYELFRSADNETKLTVHFHHPIPVGFPSEIFV